MEFGAGKAEVLSSRLEHFPAICTTNTMCHVLVRLQFRFVIIPLYQKEVMHTKETPNHHVRGAINHLLLNIKRATECPVGKQGFRHLPVSINFAFILGEDEGEHEV